MRISSVSYERRLSFSNLPTSNVQTALQRDVDWRLISERWRIVQGAVTVTVAISAAVWSQVDRGRICVWIGGYAFWVASAFWVRSGGFLPQWRDRYQTPKIINSINAARGLGSVPSPLSIGLPLLLGVNTFGTDSLTGLLKGGSIGTAISVRARSLRGHVY